MARNFGPIAVPKEIEPWLYNALNRLNQRTEQTTASIAAVGRGESPDGSGTPLFPSLTDYFYKPGILGGQTAFGDTAASGILVLSSTAAATKGKIYLGYARASAYDEANERLGIGTASPSARIHTHLADPGTIVNGAIGSTFLTASTIASSSQVDLMAWTTYGNGGLYDLAVLSGGLASTRGITFTDFTLLAGLRLAHGTYGGGSVNYCHLQAGILNAATGFSRNNNMLLVGFNDNAGTSLWANFQRVAFRTVLSTGEGNTAVSANNTMVAINYDIDEFASSTDANRFSLMLRPRAAGSVALIIADTTTSRNRFEVRDSPGGSAPARTQGTIRFAITPGIGALGDEVNLVGYQGGTETFRLSPILASIDQWAFLAPSGANHFEHASTTGLWSDSLAAISHRFALGTVNSSTRIVAFTSEGGNIFDRVGITALGVSIENTTLGGGASGISPPGGILSVRNRSGTSNIVLKVRSVASQAANVISVTNSNDRNLFNVDPNGGSTWGNNVDTGNVLLTIGGDVSGGPTRQAIVFKDNNGALGAPVLTANYTGCVGARFYAYKDVTGQFDMAYGQAGDAWVLISDESIEYNFYTGVMPVGTASFLRCTWAGNGDFTNYGFLYSRKSLGAASPGIPQLRLEETGSGTQYISVRAPSSVAANRTQNLFDLNGNIPIVGDDTPAVASGSLGAVALTNQSADIATTALTNTPPAGGYFILVYLQCTTADATAGNLTVTISWTDLVGAQTDTTITHTLTSTTNPSYGMIPIQIESGNISYAVANSGAYNNARYAIGIRIMYLGVG